MRENERQGESSCCQLCSLCNVFFFFSFYFVHNIPEDFEMSRRSFNCAEVEEIFFSKVKCLYNTQKVGWAAKSLSIEGSICTLYLHFVWFVNPDFLTFITQEREYHYLFIDWASFQIGNAKNQCAVLNLKQSPEVFLLKPIKAAGSQRFNKKWSFRLKENIS